MVQKLKLFYWSGGFWLLVELHWDGSAPRACAAECPYNTTCNDKTFTTHFLVSFCILIWRKKIEIFWTFFPMSVNFLTPPNHKGPPLWWKIWKVVQKQFLIAQKKRLDALNATQKTTAPKKSRKTLKKYHFCPKRQKMVIFESIFRIRPLLRARDIKRK